jgi:hypothetical protein
MSPDMMSAPQSQTIQRRIFMRKKSAAQSGFFNPRILAALVLCSVGVAMFGFAAMPPPGMTGSEANSLGYSRFVDSHADLLSNHANPAASMPSAQASPPSDWSVVPSPNTGLPTSNVLNSVTCVLASDCWSVGYYVGTSSGTFQTLIEHWNGTAWAIVPSPNASTSTNVLTGVTCVSASECWAVGYYASSTYQTLVERWDGTAWTIVSSPSTSAQINRLTGVTCASSSECWAVGYYGADPFQTLIERWDGSAWTIVSSPNINGGTNVLNGVTCASASDCWAVGYYGTTNLTLIERWDGTAWAIVSSPNYIPSQPTRDPYPNVLEAVTCVSASECWAVGYYAIFQTNQTLIERWDGTAWTIVTSPNTSAPQPNILTGVTCSSASECWAAGSYLANTNQTLIERWDGTSWAIVSSPNISSTPQDNYLLGVICPSASACWAVGYYGANTKQALIEQWDGTAWAIVNSPITTDTRSNTLFGVTCVSASGCWAVGFYDGVPAQANLIEHWDGSAWSVVTSPNPSATQPDVLYSVTCTSASDCWAVGGYSNGNAGQTLAEHWDGSAWAIISSPSATASDNNNLNGVTCVSASDCWAVGSYRMGSAFSSLFEHWDGTAWTIVDSPNDTPSDGSPDSVACVSASDCWAVGQGDGEPMVERWDGTAWTIVPSPNTPGYLGSVTCLSASNCWAVGSFRDPTFGSAQTLIEYWDGTAWTIITSPNRSKTDNNVLNGVACLSALDCSAVGYSGFNDSQTLIERWDGTSWAIVPSPNTSSTNRLNSVTCASGSDCWTVGIDDVPMPNQETKTLTERYTPPFPAPTPTATPSPAAPPARSLNISTRSLVQTGDNVMIGGFIITGDAPKKVIVRALGPSLVKSGLTGVLADPTLELHGPDGSLIAADDNWRENPDQALQIQGSGLPPQDDLESAIVATLAPAGYTAIVSGKSNGTGLGLVEIYDLDQEGDSKLANISTRAMVGTGDNVIIGGFILGGADGSPEMIIRAIGPSLAQLGIANSLADPTLELRDGNGMLIAFDDNWKDNPAQAAQIIAAGLPPRNDLEAAIAATLPPGAYTAVVGGKGGGTGVALVEIYNLQ